MSKRIGLSIAVVAGVAALSGCVVVPDQPGYGYGYGHGHSVRVAPPPVVVVPPPRHRYWYRHDRYRRGHGDYRP